MAVKNNDAVNNIKMLAIDMINDASEGHPGVVMSSAPIIYALYNNILNVIPNNPNWINRDRFVLSCGHASALLYSMLYFAEYDYSIEDLKRYRDVDSYAPGHPELNPSMGVECSTGLLGQGIANAVGMALAERYYENIAKNVDDKLNLIDYYTYVLCSDGDLEEGISYEALSFASKQKLNKLVVIYDANKISIDGSIQKTFTEDIETRFEALDFNIINVKNGNNVSSITDALKEAKKSDMPSLVIVNTILGDGLENAGTNKVHSGVVDKEEVLILKQKYNISLEPFNYDDNIRKFVNNNILERVSKKYNKWQIEYDKALATRNNTIINMINLIEKGDFLIDFDSTNYQINDKYSEEGRISNEKVINFIAPKTKFFVGGSADLFRSTRTIIEKDSLMTDEDPLGRNIEFGVRESAMGGILNGLAISGLRCFGSTFLAFADYLKASMRMSAMMNLPVTYIFTHDSVRVGGDGPTHEPIEQLSMLRTIPNMITFRPADINEIIGCWEYILKNKKTVSLVLNKENTKILKHTNGKYVKYGAYIVRKEKYHLDATIIATGYEVITALKIADELFNEGIDLRVVSMPSIELFLLQNPVYEEKLLPKDVLTITLEAGSTLLWNRFASNPKCALGIDTFGVSGKKEDVLKFVGFDYNVLIMKIKNMLGK